MKILVIGGSGVIGSKTVDYFIKLGYEVEFTYFSHEIPNRRGYQLDITQKNHTVDSIKKLDPDIIIHTTALTNVDLCETNHMLADSINVEGTSNVIEGCKAVGCKFVYLSTSAIFDGTKNQYFENDQASPISYYGLTKYQGEQLARDSTLSYLIIRTDQPYCWIEKWQHTNSVIRVIETLRSGKNLNEISDWYNTPTYVPNLVVAIEKLIEKKLNGIFHLSGSDFINRYDWSLKIASIFDLDQKKIKAVNSSTLNLPARRANVNLSNSKLLDMTSMKMMGIDEGLEDMHKSESM